MSRFMRVSFLKGLAFENFVASGTWFDWQRITDTSLGG